MSKQNTKIFTQRLSGKSIAELAESFNLDEASIEDIVFSMTKRIKENNKLNLHLQKTLELARLDSWTSVLEVELAVANDEEDPETGKLIKSGVKDKTLLVKTLLDISKHRTNLLKLETLDEEIRSETEELFRQITGERAMESMSIDELLEINKQLND